MALRARKAGRHPGGVGSPTPLSASTRLAHVSHAYCSAPHIFSGNCVQRARRGAGRGQEDCVGKASGQA
eukprot:29567-Prymnesium_polylepis.1